jgi:hypothetical protein
MIQFCCSCVCSPWRKWGASRAGEDSTLKHHRNVPLSDTKQQEGLNHDELFLQAYKLGTAIEKGLATEEL